MTKVERTKAIAQDLCNLLHSKHTCLFTHWFWLDHVGCKRYAGPTWGSDTLHWRTVSGLTTNVYSWPNPMSGHIQSTLHSTAAAHHQQEEKGGAVRCVDLQWRLSSPSQCFTCLRSSWVRDVALRCVSRVGWMSQPDHLWTDIWHLQVSQAPSHRGVVICIIIPTTTEVGGPSSLALQGAEGF